MRISSLNLCSRYILPLLMFLVAELIFMRIGVAECRVTGPFNESFNEKICKVVSYYKIEKPIQIVEGLHFSATGDSSFFTQKHTITVPSYVMSSKVNDSIKLAALMHELGHIKQFETLGSSTKAIDYMEGSTQIELEADFLAGCVWKALYPSIKLSKFQANLELGASYNDYNSDFHGTPPQRTAAFRYGFFGYNDLCVMEKFPHDRFKSEIIPVLYDDFLN